MWFYPLLATSEGRLSFMLLLIIRPVGDSAHDICATHISEDNSRRGQQNHPERLPSVVGAPVGRPPSAAHVLRTATTPGSVAPTEGTAGVEYRRGAHMGPEGGN